MSTDASATGGGLADPGASGIVYRNAAGSTMPSTADQVSTAFRCEASGSTNAYACNLSPAIPAYTAGTVYWFRANAANTGAATVNFNGLGAKDIKKRANQGWVMLIYDDITVADVNL